MGRPGPRRRCVAEFESQRPFRGGSATMGDVTVLIGVGGYVLFFRLILFSGLLHSDGEEGQRPEGR